MRDRSLVAFTLLSQLAVGAFWALGALRLWASWQAGATMADALTPKALFVVVVPAMILAILASFFHLGQPLTGWRAFANLRSSWLSREVLFAILFTAASALFAGLEWFELGTSRSAVAWVAALLGLPFLLCMASAYRLRTVPAWDTWVTPALFLTTALLLGGLAVGALLALSSGAPPELLDSALQWIALGAVMLLGAELVIHSLWVAGLASGSGAASRAFAKMTREHGLIFRLRLALTVGGMVVTGIILSPWGQGGNTCTAMVVAFGLVLASKVLDRLLFYEARVRCGV